MPRNAGQIALGSNNVAIRSASGSLSAAENSTPVTDLGGFSHGLIQLNVTTITTPDGDDQIDFYMQTSYDNGTSWIDMENIHFANADNGNTSKKLLVIAPAMSSAVGRAATDGTLGDDTKLDLPLGDRLRISVKITGSTAPTYAYTATGSFK
jgi:hypothetical protein